MYANGFVYDASPTTFGLALRRDDVRLALNVVSMSDDAKNLAGQRGSPAEEKPFEEDEGQVRSRSRVHVEET